VKTFERILFLIAFLFTDVYTTRHIYLRWLAPTTSVLDEFRSETETAITSAEELRQLLKKYRPSREAVRQLEQRNVGKPPDQWRFEDQEPFKTEASLRAAIEEWEAKQREIFEMRVYWTFGLIAAVAGLIVHERSSKWLGLALIITGFAEMIWWCSPAWFSQATAETDRLLNNKLILSIVTFVILIISARALGLIRDTNANHAKTSAELTMV
jgi:hypothetical protein